MDSQYCIVIPHYKHHRPLSILLPLLTTQGLPIIIVDDASGVESKRHLRKLVDQHEAVVLIEREHNGGKGAAMMTGLHMAAEQRFTHVISLDADGQHNPADVSLLLACSTADPDRVCSGYPVFGSDIPTSRLYGRMLTNSLVRLVTGSSKIKDAMCGFRVYPLQHILPLCNQIGYRTRMEFDIEILVRAVWQGLDIGSVDTEVVYPRGGESHFNLFADNARLVAMHAILILGGLRRMPGRMLKSLARREAS